MNGIFKSLNKLDTERFKPLPFWSINSKLDQKEIVRQIGEMKAYGLGGFVFHARTGLETEYLSDEWFSMVETALDQAKKLKMSVWIYDENGWPSGFAGGKLLEDRSNRACYLSYEVLNYYDKNAFAVYEYNEKTGARLLREDERINGKYHTVYKRRSDAYTDILDPKVTDKFIAETYEKYYDRYKDRFGKELAGFFTDEPQYYRYATPISSVTEKEFYRTYGQNVKEGLLYLFIQDEKGYPFRVKYYNLMNRLYCENYYQRLFCWCESKGCLLTGHTVEETYFSTQMWGSADSATSYLYEHIPAIDNLQKSLTAEISAKLIGSVSAQTGKKTVCTETFGVSGYSTTPKQLKLIADKQYVYGVDMMIQHLYNYSLAGQGKIDCPPSFGRTMPWVDGYSEFNGYFEKLGAFIANSEEHASVAVITPMESVYLDYIRLDENYSKANVDDPFSETIDMLRGYGIAYHFVNEKVLEKLGKVKDGRLIVGEREYSAVVVANCREIKSNTLLLLKEFEKGNGKTCVIGGSPKFVDGVKTETGIKGNCAAEELPKPVKFTADGLVSYCYRTFDNRNYLFIVNENKKPVTVRTEKPFSLIDLVCGKGYRAETEHVINAESSIILEENGAYLKPFGKFSARTDLTVKYLSSDKNSLTVERVTAEKENGETLSGYYFGVFETLIKSGYEGKLQVRYVFESDEDRKVTLIREKQDVYNVNFNGEPLERFTQAEEDVNFEYADIAVKKGENVYCYEVDFTALRKATAILYKKGVPESLLNCATYHTGMEQIYLRGEFDVDGYCLKRPSPKTHGDLTKQGYSDFYGAAIYETNVEKPLKNAYIRPIGDYSQCVFEINGKLYRCMMEEGVYIDELPKGKIKIKCCSTLRNRLGPFHYGSPIDDCVSPGCFTIMRYWENEKENRFYYKPKRVVPFGLTKITVEHG